LPLPKNLNKTDGYNMQVYFSLEFGEGIYRIGLEEDWCQFHHMIFLKKNGRINLLKHRMFKYTVNVDIDYSKITDLVVFFKILNIVYDKSKVQNMFSLNLSKG